MITDIQANENQIDVLNNLNKGHVFLEGPFGSGKTSTALFTIHSLIEQAAEMEKLLILVPHFAAGEAYRRYLQYTPFNINQPPAIRTLTSLARQMVELYFPVIAETAGFKQINSTPNFLTIESSQFFLASIVDPLIESGYFDAITIERNRLYSQILDNLNKAAVNDIPIHTIADRLKSAWIGKPEQLTAYEEVLNCMVLFREYCLENNLLDFSLLVETFSKHLWPNEDFQDFFLSTYNRLIYDNLEEDVPAAHNLVIQWLPHFEPSLLISDSDAGFRSFMGANPDHSQSLKTECQNTILFSESYNFNPELNSFENALSAAIKLDTYEQPITIDDSINISNHRFLTEMISDISIEIKALIDQGVPPSEIVILSPFLSDSLKFALEYELAQKGIQSWSQRPSRSLAEEPAVRAVLTLARLAHPEWEILPSREDITNLFLLSFPQTDLTRAHLLAKIVINKDLQLGSFYEIKPEIQERLTYSIGEKYEELRSYLTTYQGQETVPLDVFISLIFGDLLSQPGFGFHDRFDYAASIDSLFASIARFRSEVFPLTDLLENKLGPTFIQLLENGLTSASNNHWLNPESEEYLQISPAYTFLMKNQTVDYQFWLDIGSNGWWERLYQPLTHPYVLNINWPAGQQWTDADEFEQNQETLVRITNGLIRRCRKQVHLCITTYNEQGNEQKGPLLRSIQRLMRKIHRQGGKHV